MADETKVLIVAQIETAEVSPRTIEVIPEHMKVPGADGAMFVCYGRDKDDRKVWVATFVDAEEAQSWVHGNKMFGGPVTGAVMAGQVKQEPEGPKLEVVESGTRNSDSGPSGQAN